ncbi:UBC-like protein [Patellaria atrata CBS 101060]|uniref:UBC-like protein n=1 Tax=Patellaria atrata CBS 101060 TaxID=1346257 RepID=A0A9P4VQS1_9PEZI|nr:UBC-like protein [Patellaria atrata CBS 101060]
MWLNIVQNGFEVPSKPGLVLTSFRRQNLLLEFASLKAACPEGIYVIITPGDPSLWAGVLFIKSGPYKPAVLRFQISFPPTYPDLPPLVTFTTDIFHPLLTPLTTYTYTTGASNNDTVSATDEERLPPGGFSLRHGFPHWFGRAQKSASSSRNTSGSHLGAGTQSLSPIHDETASSHSSRMPSPSHSSALLSNKLRQSSTYIDIPIVEVLQYLKSSFTEEAVLDSITLESAANTGAYHAWKTHRGDAVKQSRSLSPQSPTSESRRSSEDGSSRFSLDPKQGGPQLARTRRPGEWNWEGVWEERVRKGIQNSLSDPVLFGNSSGGDDLIRFLDIESDAIDGLRKDIEKRESFVSAV